MATGVILGCAVVAGSPAPTRAQTAPSSPLEVTRADLAWLRPGPGATPRILVVDLPVPGPLAWRVPVSVLERDPAGGWAVTVASELRVPDASLRTERPWLVGLDPDAFALVVPSGDAQRTTTIGFEVVGDGDRAVIRERWRTTIEGLVDDGGAADVDGDGRPELVVASARTLREGDLCQGSSVWVIDALAGTTRAFEVADVRLAAGVVGSFDPTPGDDLAVYAYPNCPAGPDILWELRLVVLRLVDGTTVLDRSAADFDGASRVAPPIRFDADADGRHELLALGRGGLTIVDPRRDDQAGTRVATSAAIPLGTTRESQAAARVAWLEPGTAGRSSIRTAPIRRDAGGVLRAGSATILWDPGQPSDRWLATIAGAVSGALAQAGPPSVTTAASDGDGCEDLIVPLAVVRCGDAGVDEGPAWLGTRPLGRIPAPDGARLLVASGTEWTPGEGPPAVPAPWASGSDGRWRHGASALFVLAEIAEGDLVSGAGTARPIVRRAARPGPLARFEAERGARLLTTVAARSDTAIEPKEPTLPAALGTPIGRLSEAAVLRIPVETGEPSGGGPRHTIDLGLTGARLSSGQPAQHWAITSVALDDRGEPSAPVALMVVQDTEPPMIALDVPALTPIWPVPATLTGRVEPGATVAFVGGGPIRADDDGRFIIETPLAPWPQIVTVVATDEFGQQAEHSVSMVGGVDYRPWPWPAIVAGAVLVGVIGSGLLGRHRGRSAAPSARPSSSRGFDDGPAPELEELAPGEGLGAGRE